MKLCFWNDGKPKVVDSKCVKMPDGKERLNAKPDPDDDLYEYVEVRVGYGQYHKHVETTLDNDGWKVTKTHTYAPMPLDDVKADKIRSSRSEASRLLSKDDWMVVRETEDPTKPMPDEIKAWRSAVRDYSNIYEADIEDAADFNTLEAMQPEFPVDPRTPVEVIKE